MLGGNRSSAKWTSSRSKLKKSFAVSICLGVEDHDKFVSRTPDDHAARDGPRHRAAEERGSKANAASPLAQVAGWNPFPRPIRPIARARSTTLDAA
jgi:hypothetical protein